MRGLGISRRRRLVAMALSYAMLVLLLVVFLLPLLWIVGISFKTRLQTFAIPPLLVWKPTLQNYVAVFRRGEFLSAFCNSLVVSGGAVAISLMVGVPAAYAFARICFFGRSFLFFSLLVMRMLPPIAVLVPLYVLFNKAGLANTRSALVIAYTTFSLPLIVWIMRGFFEDMPHELEEAARVDGATRGGAFLRVLLPLARPGLVAAAILSLLLAWNDFLFAAVLTNDSTRTLPVLLAGYAGAETGVEWGPIAASGVLVVLPVIIFSFLVQRHLVAGLSSGAVK
jgi:multiple sugar transport system permease protein